MEYYLPASVIGRVILPFHEGFIFAKLHICEVSNFTYVKFRENKALAKFSEFTVIMMTRARGYKTF